jgi:hypothetical protein
LIADTTCNSALRSPVCRAAAGTPARGHGLCVSLRNTWHQQAASTLATFSLQSMATEPGAGADAECLVLPDKPEVADCLAHAVCNTHRLIERTGVEQHAELVTAKPRKRIAAAYLRMHYCRQLAEQFIAGSMAAGVIHCLEIIEVHEHERVLAFSGAARVY